MGKEGNFLYFHSIIKYEFLILLFGKWKHILVIFESNLNVIWYVMWFNMFLISLYKMSFSARYDYLIFFDYYFHFFHISTGFFQQFTTNSRWCWLAFAAKNGLDIRATFGEKQARFCESTIIWNSHRSKRTFVCRWDDQYNESKKKRASCYWCAGFVTLNRVFLLKNW